MNDNKKNLIKIGIYLGIFAVAIIVLLIDNITTNNSNSNNKTEEITDNDIISTITDIDDKNYSLNLYAYLDDDAASLQYEKNNDVVIASLKYHGEEKEYIIYNDNYYEIKDNEIIKLSNFNGFPFDKTFIYLSNIKKLLETSYSKRESTDELVLTYTTKTIMNIYNNFNGTSYITNNDDEIEIIIDKQTRQMELDLAKIYNLVYDKNYKTAKYQMTFKSHKEEDMSWLIEKLN